MANERKNREKAAGRVDTSAPTATILAGTGNFDVTRMGVGHVRVRFVENGANPGNGLAPNERVVITGAGSAGFNVVVDPAGDTETEFVVRMGTLGVPADGIFCFTVDRVMTPEGP